MTYLTDIFTCLLLPTHHESMGPCFGRKTRKGPDESALWVCEVGVHEGEMGSGEASPADVPALSLSNS